MNNEDETSLLLAAYHDGELSPSEALAMEKRLASEPELRAMSDDLRSLSTGLKMAFLTDPPPREGWRVGIVHQIGLTDGGAAAQYRQLPWIALAASLLIGMVAGGGIVGGLGLALPSARQPVSETIVAAHLRSLIASQPFDIASSDRHVVKPWFNGKTAIAPSAPDLSADGFPLIGGRVDIVSGAPVPVLVYRHDRHIISVTVLKQPGSSSEGEENHDGSNIERFRIGDLTYWAISDLNSADLQHFVRSFKTASQ